MGTTVAGIDRQLKATAGNHWQAGQPQQVGMPFLAAVPDLHRVDAPTLGRMSFSGVLTLAAQVSGLEDCQIAQELHICNGYMSRFMRGVAQQWAKRLVGFCRVTQSLAPLQWMANELGADLVPRDTRAAQVAALEAQLRELRGGERFQA